MRFPAQVSSAAFVSLGILTGVAAAAASEVLEFDARSVIVDDFIGTLNVEVRIGGTITVAMTGPDEKLADIVVRLEGENLVVRRGMGSTKVSQHFDAESYPVINIQLPAGMPLVIDDMDGEAHIGDLNAPLTIFAASLDATIGNVTSADIDRLGSGDITLGHVTGALNADLSGSGDITAASAGSVNIQKRGSGDVTLGPIARNFTANMRGSGDIDVHSAAMADIQKRGSGDVRFGTVRGEFFYRSAGIGDVDISFVDGPVTIDTTNSGKIHIHAGNADPLVVSLAEYGDFTLDGLAVDPELTVIGASIVKLQAYVGEFKATGAGDIRVGGNRVYPLSRRSKNKDPQDASAR
ncbi:MAG: GIN domain-containing protein [Alphaproteobacteria bacterium]